MIYLSCVNKEEQFSKLFYLQIFGVTTNLVKCIKMFFITLHAYTKNNSKNEMSNKKTI